MSGITVITEQDKPRCKVCGKEIRAAKKRDGTIIDAETVSASLDGMCKDCWKTRQAGA